MSDGRLRDHATNLVLQTLLPQFAKGDSAITPSDLASLTKQVGEWSALEVAQIANVAGETLDAMPWSEAATDSDAQEALWERRRRFYGTLLALVPTIPSAAVSTTIVDDLIGVLDAYELDQDTVTNFAEICGELPASLASEISDRIDVLDTPAEPEDLALHLRLLVRGHRGGQPLPASDLLALEEPLRSTPISGAWLALRPNVNEVMNVVGEFSFTPAALGRYSSHLSVDDRTGLWIEAEKDGPADQLIASLGKSGVGAGALDFVRESVNGMSREPDRSTKVKRLRLAKPAEGPASSAVQKSAALLAKDLLGNDVAGDLRSAAELMCWAGGAVARDRVELRALFDEQVKGAQKRIHKNSLRRYGEARSLEQEEIA